MPTAPKPPPIALTIAGSDSSGGAGVQADLKTFSALGVYGASVLAALTAQNTTAVTAILDVPAAFVAAQLDAVLADLDVAAIKIGMLSQAAVIEAVADRLGPRGCPLVLDPVMVSKSGAALLQPQAITALRERLVPRAAVLTPNAPEAAVLLGCDEAAIGRDPEGAAQRLRALGAGAVVLKGGHLGGARSDDLLCDAAGILRLPGVRLATRNTHGTGCTFAAAITAALAHGLPLRAAVAAAKRYLHGAIAAADGLRVGRGHGHGPVHHFHALWTPGLLAIDPDDASA